MKKSTRIVWCVKDDETGKLLPQAGIWTKLDDPEIEKFMSRVNGCVIVQCELSEV